MNVVCGATQEALECGGRGVGAWRRACFICSICLGSISCSSRFCSSVFSRVQTICQNSSEQDASALKMSPEPVTGRAHALRIA